MSNWSASQLAYAKTIIDVGKQRHATNRDIQTALMVALTESSMQNLANSNVPESLSITHDGVGSDHASVGLFQQQVGIWGDAQTLMNPAASANLFYDKLLNIPARDHLAPWQLAQSIQKSADQSGSNYQKNLDQATQLMADAGGGNPGDITGIIPGQIGNSPSQSVLDKLSSMVKWLTDSKNWQRIGIGTLGAILLIIALIKWFSGTKVAQQIGHTAKSVAEVAAIA